MEVKPSISSPEYTVEIKKEYKLNLPLIQVKTEFFKEFENHQTLSVIKEEHSEINNQKVETSDLNVVDVKKDLFKTSTDLNIVKHEFIDCDVPEYCDIPTLKSEFDQPFSDEESPELLQQVKEENSKNVIKKYSGLICQNSK